MPIFETTKRVSLSSVKTAFLSSDRHSVAEENRKLIGCRFPISDRDGSLSGNVVESQVKQLRRRPGTNRGSWSLYAGLMLTDSMALVVKTMAKNTDPLYK